MYILSMSRLVLFWKSRSVLGQWCSSYRERVRRFHNPLCWNCEVIWTHFSALTKTYNLLGHLLLQRWSLDRWRALQFSQSNCWFGILVWLSESVSRQRRNCRAAITWSTIHIQVKYPIKNYYNNTIFLNSVLSFWKTNRCLTILETTEEPEKVEFKLKRKYFLLMGRKVWNNFHFLQSSNSK